MEKQTREPLVHGSLGEEMSEMGKAAKHMGHVHPSDLRRAPAMPDKPTPAKGHHKPERKLFGYSFQWHSRWRGERKTLKRWFKTETARNQSLAKILSENEGEHAYYQNITALNPPASQEPS